MSEWINVKDRLPEEGVPVLTNQIHDYCNNDGYYEICVDILVKGEKRNKWLRTDGFGRKVTHWMPLPEPPTEVD